MTKNPYLKDRRLADVIAAVTVLGTYKFYKLEVAAWASRISGSSEGARHWLPVFEEDPEFFRMTSDNKVSLVWRRQFSRNFEVDAEPEIIPDHDIDGNKESRISRRPLTPSELTALLDVAINLHDRALEQHKARGWWIPLFAAGLSFFGAMLGASIARSGGG